MEFYFNKRVFVTGGSSGIGLETAKYLASWGASVWIAARGEQRLKDGLVEVEAKRVNATQRFGYISVDVGDPQAVREAAAKVLSDDGLGGLDVLINNAGVAHPARILETSDDIYEHMMRVNYFGAVYVTRAFLPHLFEQKRGNIAMVSSMLGFMGIYGYTAYAASKYAMTGFADALRQELIDHNVHMTVVFPPDTDTPQWHEENKIKPAETKAIAGNVKVLPPEDVALVMLKAIAKNKYHVVPGGMGKFTHFMHRHAPGVVRWVIDGELKKFRKKHPGASA